VNSKLKRISKEKIVTCFEVDRIPRHMPGDTFETTKISALRQSLYQNIQGDSGEKVDIFVSDTINCCKRKGFI
jgi:hypothetical protein